MTTSAAPDLVAAFLAYLRYERRCSPYTVEHYGESLHLFCDYFTQLDEQLTWETIDLDVVRGWIEHQMDRGNSPTTVNQRLCALRSMYRFAKKRDLVSHNPVRLLKGPKAPKPLPKFLKESEVDALLDDHSWEDDYESQRNRMIILLFYTTGMRVGELLRLNDSDIDYARNEIHVVGKGNKQRNIPFARELREALQEYLACRNYHVARHSPALLLTAGGQRMNYGQVAYIVKKLLGTVTTQQARSPHVLRHTFATALMNHDAHIETVKELLGHKSVRTTTIYTHTTFEQLKRVYTQAHPRHTTTDTDTDNTPK